MYPSLETGQYLLISRLNYLFAEPERGDILVFHVPENPQVDFVKRLIGLPNEVVEFRNQQVYINGQVLPELYLNEVCSPEHCPDAFWQLANDEYFVLGDNRNHSADSRYFGAIHRDYILGEAVLRYYPFSDFAWIAQIGLN